MSSLVGSESVVRLLALMGEDIDALTGGGWTPLMLAAHAGKGAVAKILVRAHHRWIVASREPTTDGLLQGNAAVLCK